MKAKFYAIFLGALAAMLAGCGPTITNLTSQQVPQNASGIYTLSMTVRNADGAIAESSFEPKVVIDGTARSMTASELGKGVYEYDYVIPDGRSEARYYYVLDYSREGGSSRKEISDIFDLYLANRYVLTMESLRGPVGARIPVVGRGFTEFDRVVIGGFEAETEFQSPTSIVFTVPPLAANQSYRAELISGFGGQDLGRFHVDGSKLSVFPNPIELNTGERSTLGVSIEFPASANGQPINVMTDIPQKIIMPEIAIAPGARTVSVPIQGTKPGSGFLYISAPGYNEITVPVTITGEASAYSNSGSQSTRSETIIMEEREMIIQDNGDDMILGEAEIIEIN